MHPELLDLIRSATSVLNLLWWFATVYLIAFGVYILAIMLKASR